LFLTLLVFALDVWAVNAILGGQDRAWAKARWIITVIALPVAGFVLWRMTGKKASPA
jgi:hypothetical protein